MTTPSPTSLSSSPAPATARTPSRRHSNSNNSPRSKAAILSVLLTPALALALCGPAAAATIPPPSPPSPSSTAAPAPEGRSTALQSRLDALVAADGLPGALAAVRDSHGGVIDYTAGVSDLQTGDPMHPDGQVRIASNTKTFTATVVLQLVDEGLVDLEAPVETYLPGVIRGAGGDGHQITVRQVLQQTSGLPGYDALLLADSGGDLSTIVDHYYEPHQLLANALQAPAAFAPGTSWQYSNTNYIVAGLLVQAVTHRPIGEEITERIIEPLGLQDTYWPQEGERDLRGEHPRGYFAVRAGDAWIDVTQNDPSFGWAAGQLVSTPSDLARFFSALLAGKLLQPEQLKAMTTTVPAPGFDTTPGWSYGLGLASVPLSCGGLAWGHGGDIQGYETRNLATSDGRSAVVAVTALPASEEGITRVNQAVDTALCP